MSTLIDLPSNANLQKPALKGLPWQVYSESLILEVCPQRSILSDLTLKIDIFEMYVLLQPLIFQSEIAFSNYFK